LRRVLRPFQTSEWSPPSFRSSTGSIVKPSLAKGRTMPRPSEHRPVRRRT
jgi:hypothetical protein